MLPKNTINQIKLFTALVKPRPFDIEQPVRQQTYLRALSTLPNVEIIYGHFLTHVISMPSAESYPDKLQYVKVIKSEEKGSDVNIASHFLFDAFHNKYDIGVIISNDSDLLAPLVMAKKLGKIVGVLNPQQKPSRVLLKEAIFFKSIRKSALENSQFPSELSDKNGIFHKPKSW